VSNIAQLALGQGFTCALQMGGSIQCWGDGTWGQLGNGTNPGTGGWSSTPVAVNGIADASFVAAGVSHACAIHKAGGVACWGSNLDGELGVGTFSKGSSTPVNLAPFGAPMDSTVALGAGEEFTCALQASGAVFCWGWAQTGQLGYGNVVNQSQPVPVYNLTDAVALSCGRRHACAVRKSGTVVCWGSDSSGQLGDGAFSGGWAIPVPVLSVTGATAIAAGETHTCAMTGAGAVWCWGANTNGQLAPGPGLIGGAAPPARIMGF
jgi:alpha-tubulin suppressor-like RCC1 family protein